VGAATLLKTIVLKIGGKPAKPSVFTRRASVSAGSLLVPAERAFWFRDLIEHSVRNPMFSHSHTRVRRTRLAREQRRYWAAGGR